VLLDRPDRRQLPAAKDLSRDEHRKPGGVHRQRDAALLDLIQGQPGDGVQQHHAVIGKRVTRHLEEAFPTVVAEVLEGADR
jgi:hypothetical protein